jgi:hypothetical protein
MARLLNAKHVEDAAKAEVRRANAHVQDLIAVTLSMVDAPPTAVIDIEFGSILWPESPADADENGVSKAVTSTPVAPPPSDASVTGGV